jgi:uncharacterized protein (DUF2147 family)
MPKFSIFLILFGLNHLCFAQEISGTWKTIDDKSGNPKALIEIRKTANDQFIGTIIKLFPPIGFEAVDICQNCPPPYTSKPMLGMEILKNLKYNAQSDSYEHGKILDPRQGKLYNANAKLRNDGKRLYIRGYIGLNALGRNQVWIRQ